MGSKVAELDYRGILPYDKETQAEFIHRGEEFLQNAYALNEMLRENPFELLKENKEYTNNPNDIFRAIRTGEFRVVDNDRGFFLRAYSTDPSWVSVIEMKCEDTSEAKERNGSLAGFEGRATVNGCNVPLAVVDSRKNTAGMKTLYICTERHEITHCIRKPISEYLDYPINNPLRLYARSPEENLIRGLTNDSWDHTSLKSSKENFKSDALMGTGCAIASLMLFEMQLSIYGVPLSALGLTFIPFSALFGIESIANYCSYKNTAITKSAFDKILAGEEADSLENFEVQYALLRLTPPEIREIGKNMYYERSSKKATKDFLKKQKNLRSKIILEKIS